MSGADVFCYQCHTHYDYVEYRQFLHCVGRGKGYYWICGNCKRIRESNKIAHYRHLPVAVTKHFLRLCELLDGMCPCCFRKGLKLTIDHIVPRSKGGTDDPSNIQPLCGSCNARKGARHSTDYLKGILHARRVA